MRRLVLYLNQKAWRFIMKVLLVDVGSTRIKWAVYDTKIKSDSESGGCLFPRRLDNPLAEVYEVSAEEIAALFMDILRQKRKKIQGIFLSVQMHGYFLADEQGTLLTPYVSWRDRRAALKAASGKSFLELFSEQYGQYIDSRAGTSLKDNLPVISLYANQYLFPELYEKSRVFYTLGSYLVYLLTGRNVTHITDGAATGFYRVKECRPNGELPVSLELPKVTRSFEQAGTWESIPVFTPVGDHQASIYGCYEPGRKPYVLNLGTAAQISALTDRPCDGAFENRPYFDSRTLCTVSGLPGGRHILSVPEIEDVMVEKYREALEALPQRKSIVVTGGAAGHYPELIDRVCGRLRLPYTVAHNAGALRGLSLLADGIGEQAV